MLKTTVFIIGVSVFSLAGPLAARAAEHLEIDVSGDWRVDIDQKRGRCRWQGRVHLDQNGVRLTGAGEAAAPPAQRFCPRLEGAVEGGVDGPQVNFGFATGRLGTGAFEGVLAPDGRRLSGTWSAGKAEGTWSAERLD